MVWGMLLFSMNYMSIILYEFCITSVHTLYQTKLAGCLFWSTEGAIQVFCAVVPPLWRLYFPILYVSGGQQEIFQGILMHSLIL